MQNIKAIVADDELFGREQVKSALKKYFPQIALVAEATDGNEAIQLIHFHKPDLVFLDIEMPHKNGFDVLEGLHEPDFEIIFITAFDQYALKAIKFSALDYLLKPLDREEFKKAVEKFLEKQKYSYDRKSLIKNFILNVKSKQTSHFKLAVHTSGKTYFLNTDEIIRCEADGNYTRIFKADKEEVFTAKTLKEFDDILCEHGFIRVHRGHLINKKFVSSLNKDHYLLLQDGKSIEVSRRKLAEIKNFFTG